MQVSEAEEDLLNTIQENFFFKEIFDHADFGLALTDAHGKLLNANARFAKIEQQTQHKFLFDDLLKEGVFEDSNEVKAFSSGLFFFKIARFRVIRKDTVLYVWMVAPDPEAESNKKFGSLLNLYRSFVDTTFELVFRTNRKGQILFTNRLFINQLGFSHYRMVKHRDIKSLFEDEKLYGNLILKLDRQKTITAEKIELKKADGTKLIGLLNGNLTHDSRGNELINWRMLNISDQVESENKLKVQNDELEKANHQIEKFLYSTSHDLRSPLTSILGLVNLMLLEKPEPLMLDYIRKIESTTLKLDKIIRDIVSFSKTTYQHGSSEKIDFEALAWRIINTHQSDSNLKRIHVNVQTIGAFPFFGDAQRIEIVFENIVGNAIHFFDPTKSRPFVTININIKKENAAIEFIDNGIGIGQQHLGEVFNMFYKATHRSKGAGLGLFIVKETLEKIKGTINIESEVGFGTVVRISIPNDHKGILMSRKLELKHQSI